MLRALRAHPRRLPRAHDGRRDRPAARPTSRPTTATATSCTSASTSRSCTARGTPRGSAPRSSSSSACSRPTALARPRARQPRRPAPRDVATTIPRSATRAPALAAMMLLTLRGTPFLYYGEEIGMRNVAIPKERLQDPLARTLHPSLSRDPERTPMCWDRIAGRRLHDRRRAVAAARSAAAAHRRRDAARGPRVAALALQGPARAAPRAPVAAPRQLPDARRARRRASPTSAAATREVARVALNFGDEPRRVDLGPGRAVASLATRPARRSPAQLDAIELGPAEGIVVVL